MGPSSKLFGILCSSPVIVRMSQLMSSLMDRNHVCSVALLFAMCLVFLSAFARTQSNLRAQAPTKPPHVVSVVS